MANYLALQSKKATKLEDIKQSLIDLAWFDEDVNGGNGPDFTWEIAEAAGYETTAEYLADEAIKAAKKEGTLYEQIEDAANKYASIWSSLDGYYDDIQAEVVECDGVYSIALAAIMND
jgi:hypothetical protein